MLPATFQSIKNWSKLFKHRLLATSNYGQKLSIFFPALPNKDQTIKKHSRIHLDSFWTLYSSKTAWGVTWGSKRFGLGGIFDPKSLEKLIKKLQGLSSKVLRYFSLSLEGFGALEKLPNRNWMILAKFWYHRCSGYATRIVIFDMISLFCILASMPYVSTYPKCWRIVARCVVEAVTSRRGACESEFSKKGHES